MAGGGCHTHTHTNTQGKHERWKQPRGGIQADHCPQLRDPAGQQLYGGRNSPSNFKTICRCLLTWLPHLALRGSILRPAVPASLQKRLATAQREARQLPRIRGPRERPTAGGTAKAIIFGGGHGVGERLSRRGKFGGFWKGKMQLLCNRSAAGGQELARILRPQCFPPSRVQLLCLIPRRHVIFSQLCSPKRFLANIPRRA